MTAAEKFLQCTLTKSHSLGESTKTTFLPAKYAKLNGVVKLRDDSGEWEDGWKVSHVGAEMLSKEELPDSRKAVREHRKKTGDSRGY